MAEGLNPGSEYQNWEAPTPAENNGSGFVPERKRPGGELQGKLIQGKDGQWYDRFGQRIETVELSAGHSTQALDKNIEYAQRF